MGSLSNSMGSLAGSMGKLPGAAGGMGAAGGAMGRMPALGGLMPGQNKLPAGAGGGPPTSMSMTPGAATGATPGAPTGAVGGGMMGALLQQPGAQQAMTQVGNTMRMFGKGNQFQQQLQQTFPQMGAAQGAATGAAGGEKGGDQTAKGDQQHAGGGMGSFPGNGGFLGAMGPARFPMGGGWMGGGMTPGVAGGLGTGFMPAQQGGPPSSGHPQPGAGLQQLPGVGAGGPGGGPLTARGAMGWPQQGGWRGGIV